MTPATYNFSLVRGTTAPFTFTLQADDGNGGVENIPYTDVRLSIYKKNGRDFIMRHSLENGRIELVDALTNKFSWTPTPEESRLVEKGEKTIYELELRNNTSELVYLMGTIEGIGGINDDEEAS